MPIGANEMVDFQSKAVRPGNAAVNSENEAVGFQCEAVNSRNEAVKRRQVPCPTEKRSMNKPKRSMTKGYAIHEEIKTLHDQNRQGRILNNLIPDIHQSQENQGKMNFQGGERDGEIFPVQP